MSNLLITDNIDIIDGDGEILNVYVTEDKLTIRVVAEVENIDTSNTSVLNIEHLLSHDSYYTKDAYNTVTDEFVKPLEYVFKHNDSLWFVYSECTICKDDILEWDTNSEISVRVGTTISNESTVVYDRVPHTYLLKNALINSRALHDSRYNNETFNTVCVTFLVLDKNLNFESCPKSVKCNKGIYSNLSFGTTVSAIAANRLDVEKSWYENESLNVVLECQENARPNETIDVTVIVKKDGELYPLNHQYIVDAIDGYSPHNRVSVVNGVGKFKMQALHLKPGEKMTFKLNDGFYTSKSEKTVNIF